MYLVRRTVHGALAFNVVPVLCRRTILAIVLGQVLSILLCGTAVFNQILKTEFLFTSSVSQSYVAYLLLGIVFAPILAARRDFLSILLKNWWKYGLLALVGVEANYLMVTAQEYTSLTSMQVCMCVCVCACARVCVRACACAHACV